MIRIASKMWLYFGFVGNLSILVWLISGVLLARYARHERRTRGWWAALIVALVAFGLARANSDSVSQILPDQRAELEDASERSERERAGLNPHKSVREDMKAAVHIADDEDEEDKDKGDGYGGYDEETGKTNMYEAAAAGKAAPEDGAGKETQPAEGAETAAAGGEGDGPPREPGEIEDPEAPADPFAYRTGGKVARDGDKKEDAGDLGKAANVKQSQDAQNVKMLRQRDLHRAQHIDQLNLCASRFMLWLAVCLVFADYMGRFNKTFDSYFPLPLSSRLVDSVCSKALRILVRRSAPGLVVEYLERAVRKGETFIYFGADDPWHAAAGGRTENWDHPYLTRRRKIGSEVRGEKSRAGTPLPRLRALAFGAWTVNKLVCDSDESFYGSTFAFEAAWFNRHCFVVRGDELGAKWLGDLLRFLRLRHRALARSRQTVNIVLDEGSPVRRSTLRELLFLCEEANYKIMVVMPDAEPEIAELFEEVHDDLPEQEPHALDDLMEKLGAVRSGDKSLKDLSREWFIEGVAAARTAGGLMARKAGETKDRLAAAQAALAERRARAKREAAERAERRRQEAEKRRLEEEARRKAEEEARKKAEEEAGRRAEEEARRQAEEEARRKAEEAARRKAEEEARKKAEAEEARRRAEEERLKAEQEAKERAEREAREAAAREAAEREAREQAERQKREMEELAARQAAEQQARVKAQEEAVAEGRPSPAPEPVQEAAPEPSSFKFACPTCGQKLEAQADWIGMEAGCPGCGTAVVVPSPDEAGVEKEPAAAAGGEFKFLCPSCGQKLAAEPSWIGMELECPSCRETLIVPSPIPEL